MSFKVVGIGEVLWDLLPTGPQLGGAPANFCCHARQFGANAQVITRVGKDANGRRVLQFFQDRGINADTVQVDDALATGTATVRLDSDGAPQFAIDSNVAWDALSLTEDALEAVQNAQAVCFGTLAQRSKAAASTIQQLVDAASASAFRVFDVNLRQKFFTTHIVQQSLELANVVKLNEHELAILAVMFDLRGTENQKIAQLARRFDLEVVALTRGENGSLLHQAGNWSGMPGTRTRVVDTVGAGDAFAAGLVFGLLNKLSLENVHRIAAEVATYVCSRSGATPALPKTMLAAFASSCPSV